MRVEVEVTQQDIDEGSPCAPGVCPIALALRRALKHEWVSVGTDEFDIENNKGVKSKTIALPRSAQAFIRGFDNTNSRGDVTPFKFTLEVPES